MSEVIVISATELARSTREVLDKVAHGGSTVAIERNNVLIAQLVPTQRVMNASQALGDLNLPVLTRTQTATWLKESRGESLKGRRSDHFDQTVRDPWT